MHPNREMTMSNELKPNRTDRVVTAAKAVFGIVPVGSVISEVIGELIPNQRMDRLVRFVEMLGQKVEHLDDEVFRKRATHPDGVNLIEDGFFHAARAKSEARLEQIANIVANGLSANEQKRLEADRMLWILEKLNDVEVVLLRGSLPRTAQDYGLDEEYQTKHQIILEPRAPHHGSEWSEIEEAALFDSYRGHLIELNLMKVNFKTPKRGEIPELDEKTGTMKASGRDITLLGRMFLDYLGLIPEWARQ